GSLCLYLAKDVFGRRNLPVNALIRNAGPGCGGWCFTDVSKGSGADVRADAMGVAVGDYNRDGKLDLYFSNSGSGYNGPAVLLANVGGSFREVRNAGVNADGWSWGTAFLDVDDDGWPDLYLAVGGGHVRGQPVGGQNTDRLFRNRGDGTFADITDRTGTY